MSKSRKLRFLVARKVEGRWQKVSESGYFLPGVGAAHPLKEPMTEAAHDAISRAAAWLFYEPVMPQSVDVEADGETYRVSPLQEA